MATSDALEELRQTFGGGGPRTGRRPVPRVRPVADAVSELRGIMAESQQEPVRPVYPSTLSHVGPALSDTLRQVGARGVDYLRSVPRAVSQGVETITSPPAADESLLASAFRGIKGAAEIASAPFMPQIEALGDVAAGGERALEATGLPAAVDPALRRGAEVVTNVLSGTPGGPVTMEPTTPESREQAARVIGQTAGGLLPLPLSVVGRAFRGVRPPEVVPPAPPRVEVLPPRELPGQIGQPRALSPAPIEARGTIGVPRTFYGLGETQRALPPAPPEIAAGTAYRARPYPEEPPILPGRPSLGAAERALPARVEEPPRALPTAEEVAARRAGFDPTQPPERPSTILDAQGRPIMVLRSGFRPTVREPEPPPMTPAVTPRPPEPPPVAPQPGEIRSGAAPAEFVGWQETGQGKPPIALYNMTKDVGRYRVGSTVSDETLRGMGYEPPEPTIASPTPHSATQATNLESLPRFERTPMGDQALIPGAEARAIPTTKTRSEVPQASPGGLFEKPATATQEALPEVPTQRSGEVIRAATPPEDLGVSLEEWQGMKPSERQWALDFFRDAWQDESGRIDLGKMSDDWKQRLRSLRQRFPMEGEVRKVTPDSPTVAAIERFNSFAADWMARFTSTPVYKALQKMTPAEVMDLDEQMASGFKAGTISKLGEGQGVPSHVQGYLRFRERRLQNQEQAARSYFNLDPIPETPGPYLPRVTKREAREAVSLGGGRLGLGRDIQTTVRGHQQERLFESMRQGERVGTEYDDPRNAILLREWEGTKLIATHRLFQELEHKGVLFRDRAAAMAANARVPRRTGGPWRIENAPGGEWWARTEEEAKLLQQNLTEPTHGTNLISSFVHYANAFIRTPGLFNPLPHLMKNMGYKYLLQRGPVGAAELGVKAVEYARGSNPSRLAEFREAMPFSQSGRTAADVLHTELRQGAVRDAIKGIERAATFASRKLSQPAVFKYGDPAMRYALFDYYRRQGMSVYEAGNHAWQDLVRYGTRGWVTDEWKSIPMNFFVPWRYGTVVSLLKAAKNHPVRTALTVGGIEYLREARYRQTGRWTHLPIDYVEKPIALVAQERNPADLPAVIGTLALFGPGGDFTASNLIDMVKTVESGSGRGLQDPDTQRRLRNMFWAVSQAYEIPTQIAEAAQTRDPEHLVNAFLSAVVAEHDALSSAPRRLGRALPEWLPGMTRAPIVQEAEALQQRKRERAQRYQERRATHGRPSISEQVHRRYGP